MWNLNESDFIEVDISPEMKKESDTRNKMFYDKYGNTGTHRLDKNRQRNTGYLAEMSVKLVFPKLEFSKDPTVDFILNDITFDVKAQGCNSAPKTNFTAALYEEQDNRKVDYYIFCRVKNDFTKSWITGFISKQEFLSKANLSLPGTQNNNFKLEESRYEIEYNKLIKPYHLVNI
jgi:hypothetical protein